MLYNFASLTQALRWPEKGQISHMGQFLVINKHMDQAIFKIFVVVSVLREELEILYIGSFRVNLLKK